MIELKKSHTGQYLAEEIIKRLNELGIDLKQIITITTDNGANVLKMIRDMENILKQKVAGNEPPPTPVKIAQASNKNRVDEFMDDDEAIEREIELCVTSDDDHSHELSDDDAVIQALFDEEDDDEYDEPTESTLRKNSDLLSEMNSNMNVAHGLNVMWEIKGIDCAAHTLQLAIGYAINSTTNKNRNVIRLSRSVTKLLRNHTTKHALNEAGINYKVPRIDVATRWGSTYLMVSFKLIFLYKLRLLV